MLIHAPAILFYPLALAWSLVYGLLGGAIYNLLAVYENWRFENRYHVLLWKKYPQRSYRKYIAGIWTSQIRGKPVELAEYTKLQIERRHPAEPFPLIKILVNTLFMLFIAPFMMLIGMLKGPAYVFQKLLDRRAGKFTVPGYS